MITTITIEANFESELIKKLSEITNSLKDGSLYNNELMDGSFQVGTSNVEVDFT